MTETKVRLKSRKQHILSLSSGTWVKMGHCQQAQIQDYLCFVRSEWVWGISYADCRAINNILMWWGCVCLFAWHLGFNSRRKIPYLHDPTNTSHLKRIQMRDGPTILPQSPSTTGKATYSDLDWLNIPLWSAFWKPNLQYVSIVWMYWAAIKVLGCEQGFEMKYFSY